jgi:hypothetical protein
MEFRADCRVVGGQPAAEKAGLPPSGLGETARSRGAKTRRLRSHEHTSCSYAISPRGWSISAVGRHVGRDRKTIRCYLSDPEARPGERPRDGRTTETPQHTTDIAQRHPHLQMERRAEPAGRPIHADWRSVTGTRSSPVASAQLRMRPAGDDPW